MVWMVHGATPEWPQLQLRPVRGRDDEGPDWAVRAGRWATGDGRSHSRRRSASSPYLPADDLLT